MHIKRKRVSTAKYLASVDLNVKAFIQAEPWHGLMPHDFVTLVKGLSADYKIVRPDTIFQMMRSVNQLPTDPLDSK